MPASKLGDGTQNEALRKFFRWIMREGPFSGCDLDGGMVQDKAYALKLIVEDDDGYVIAPGIIGE